MDFNLNEDILDYEEDDFDFDFNDLSTAKDDGNQDDNLLGFDDVDNNININEKKTEECESLISNKLPSTSVSTENNVVEGDQQVKTDFVDNKSAKTETNVIQSKNTFKQKENGSNYVGTELLGKKRKRSRPFRLLNEKKKKFGEVYCNSYPKAKNNRKMGRKNFAMSNGLNNCNTPSRLNYYNGLPIFFGAKPETIRSNGLNLERTNVNILNTNDGYKKAVEYYTKNKTLEESEKEIIKMKKEARAKRFMNDRRNQEIGNASRCLQGKVPKKNDLYFEKEYFIKMEEQKRKREEIMSLKEKQKDLRNFDAFGFDEPQMNPYTGKNCLLQKKNPFDAFPEAAFPSFGTKIKQEVVEVEEDIKPPIFLNSSINHSFGLPKQELKNGLNHYIKSRTSDEGLCVYKKRTNTGVKFVRTISKTFEELKLSKIKSDNSL